MHHDTNIHNVFFAPLEIQDIPCNPNDRSFPPCDTHHYRNKPGRVSLSLGSSLRLAGFGRALIETLKIKRDLLFLVVANLVLVGKRKISEILECKRKK